MIDILSFDDVVTKGSVNDKYIALSSLKSLVDKIDKKDFSVLNDIKSLQKAVKHGSS